MNGEQILLEAWEWLMDYWDRHAVIKTFAEDKLLCEERKKWYKETMPKMKMVSTNERLRVVEELNIIYKASDMSCYYP